MPKVSCRWKKTKSGQRSGALEATSIECKLITQWVSMWQQVRESKAGPYARFWPDTPAAFRRQFASLLAEFQLEEFGFKPYSCRRGGATEYFTRSGSMEGTLARGRWNSNRIARIYINDGLASLASLSLTAAQKSGLKSAAAHLKDVS